jgi:hypothetical protein
VAGREMEEKVVEGGEEVVRREGEIVEEREDFPWKLDDNEIGGD